MNHIVKLLALTGLCAAVSFSAESLADTLADRDPAGAPHTRELAWEGGESLVVDVPAHVRLVQAEGPGRVVVTGARRSVERFTSSGGVLRDERWHSGKPLEILIRAPKITHVSLKGTDKLVIEGFDQPELHIEMLGRSEVTASGLVGKLRLQLQGSGWADLSALLALDAEVAVSGSRHALVSATGRARITGNGAVVLVTQPQQVDLDLGESGRVFSLGAAQTAHKAD
jgi:Putative auto-transporter adhesin, head GIN domain